MVETGPLTHRQIIVVLTGAVKEHVLAAFSNALDDVFFIGVPVVVLAFFVALALKEIPLRSGAAT